MSNLSLEAKVGVFVIAGLIALGYLSMRFGNFSLGEAPGYTLNTTFDNASGLQKDVQVEIAGVEVGRVKSIGLQEGKALVTLLINADIRLTRDVRAIIRTKGILGDKYVELIPGSSELPQLQAGERIIHTTPTTDIDTLMNILGEVAYDIKQLTTVFANVIGGDQGEASLRAIMENTSEMVRTLNRTISDNNEDVNRIVANLADFSETLRTFGDANQNDIVQVIGSVRNAAVKIEHLMTSINRVVAKVNSGQGTLGRLVNDDTALVNLNRALASLREISDKINSGDGTFGRLLNDGSTADSIDDTFDSLKRIAAKVDRGQGTIGKLLNDDATIENINSAVSGINDLLEKQDTFKTYLDYRGEYMVENRELKSYLSLKVQPREDKYYLFQIVDDPDGKEYITDTTTTSGATTSSQRVVERKRNEFLFSAQIAKRYYDLGLRGGLIESTGGIGADYYLFNDRLTLSMEAFDFDPDEGAHLRFKVDYSPLKHIYLTAGVDDFISSDGNRSVFFGAGINFLDDDIKTLLTNIPIPTN